MGRVVMGLQGAVDSLATPLLPADPPSSIKLKDVANPRRAHNPQPSTLNPEPFTLNPQPVALNHQPSTINPQTSTINPQPLY